MKRILQYFHFDKIGLLEFLFVLYPILSSYGYWVFVVLLLLDAISLKRTKGLIGNPSMKWLLLFLLVHEAILAVVSTETSVLMFNATLMQAITAFSVIIIAPALKYDKLIGCLYLVSLVAMVGLVYHFILIRAGQSVLMLRLPFLGNMTGGRLMEYSDRPISFFPEPSSYATFMFVPLFLTLSERKYLFSFVILLLMFLSTSSNGIILSMIMVLSYILLSSGVKIWNKVWVFILFGFSIYFLLYSPDYFEHGLEKIMAIDASTDGRIATGPGIVSNMPLMDIILGIPSPNIDVYYRLHLINTMYITESVGGGIFVSSFWMFLIKLGIVGLILYLNLYYGLAKQSRLLWPYIITIFVASFTEGLYFNPLFMFEFTFAFFFVNYSKSLNEPQIK